ncbi:Gldg family protein [Psychrosphaera aquimarina]|uniref:Gldg family protein n=1 Tax=Psychrosphaera aquimarina TaxID=2044854 RepID=A0ABU3R186_9GAMM|nr:Gldg family protein [Psychrosphaera aquimarina]MDU0113048.1 Gldg family protein [Psychrosphaera aquimarina]
MHSKSSVKRVSFTTALVAIAFVFLTLVLLNNTIFNKTRLDLTQGNVYSITEGTHQVLSAIEEPITLYFFFSNKASEGLTTLRNYANRVKSLLQEYELYAGGKIKLQIIDPEAFSEAEDKAAEMGLVAAPINAAGDSIYFGLAGTNSLDDKEIIAFFDPSQESLLEYELSKLVHRLSDPTPVKVSVLSSLPIQGGMNPNPMAMQMGQPQALPQWAVLSQLEQLYQVEVLEPTAETIPEDTKVLMLVHPKDLTDAQLFAIDQFVLNGGKTLVFVDPTADSDQQGANMMGMPAPSTSNLSSLFSAWGIEFDDSAIVLDAAKGLEIRMPDGQPGRHIGYIGLDKDNINGQDVVTTSLSSINVASAGALRLVEGATTTLSPLMTSSEYADFTDIAKYQMAGQNPELLLNDFEARNADLILAARVSGSANTAFDSLPEGIDEEGWIKSSDDIQLIVVADTDLLTDRFWVQSSNFFGETILQPFANNGDFVINAVDNLGGNSALLSIRGRGQYQRPFDVVEQLTVEAEAKFREQEQQLQQQLEETESQLAQLQNQQMDNSALVLTVEQEDALASFVAKKLEIRKQLREVQHQLNKDIESLGTTVKLLNIVVFPLLLTFGLALFARRYRLKMSASYQVK